MFLQLFFGRSSVVLRFKSEEQPKNKLEKTEEKKNRDISKI